MEVPAFQAQWRRMCKEMIQLARLMSQQMRTWVRTPWLTRSLSMYLRSLGLVNLWQTAQVAHSIDIVALNLPCPPTPESVSHLQQQQEACAHTSVRRYGAGRA
eukprot:3435493-Amphidinium_carterae.1